jgi:hypothetical protein
MADVALALAENDHSRAWRWIVQREEISTASPKRGSADILGRWARADADSLCSALLANPNAPGSDTMIEALTSVHMKTSPESRRSWFASLPPEIAQRVNPGFLR